MCFCGCSFARMLPLALLCIAARIFEYFIAFPVIFLHICTHRTENSSSFPSFLSFYSLTMNK